MSMAYDLFLAQVIDRGIESVKADEHMKPKSIEGSIRGFEACRGKTPEQLRALHEQTQKDGMSAYWKANQKDADIEDYWADRYYAIQIEWVCNCVSAALVSQGVEPIVPPTYRGMMLASRILGVAAAD